MQITIRMPIKWHELYHSEIDVIPYVRSIRSTLFVLQTGALQVEERFPERYYRPIDIVVLMKYIWIRQVK